MIYEKNKNQFKITRKNSALSSAMSGVLRHPMRKRVKCRVLILDALCISFLMFIDVYIVQSTHNLCLDDFTYIFNISSTMTI